MRIRFGPFTLDFDTRQLKRQDRDIHLAPKAFELLQVLVTERPKVLSKTSLQDGLWPDTFVAEANLPNLIAEIREALGDQARAPRFIRTVHGFGYAFSGDAVVVPGASDSGVNRSTCWLEWGRRRFPLAVGEHVIGRDPDVDVSIEASTVSRRHAKLVVTDDAVVLEDFGSKNGTRRGGERVTSQVTLTDGDAIRIGSVMLTFRVRDRSISTDTQLTLTS